MANWPDYSPTRLLKRLSDADVDFVVVGGVAVVAQGYPRLTNDLDICYATDPANLDRLGELLVAIEAKLRGVEEDLPFVPDGRALRKAHILTLSTRDGELDLLVAPPGAPAYSTLRRRADRIEVAGAHVLIASIEDLLAMKRAGGRPQDLIDVEALEVALRRRQ